MKSYNLLDSICLHLFDGAGDGAAAGAAAADAGDTGGAQQTDPAATRRGKSGGEGTVVQYGKQPEPETDPSETDPDAEGQEEPAAPTPEEKRKAYRELIRGEYAEQYQADFQEKFDKRFRAAKAAEEQLAAAQPVLDLLMQRYNLSDMGELMAAVEGDKSYWEEAAEQEGMSVEQYQRMQRLERENAAYQRMQRARQGEAAVQAQLQKWTGEADALKAEYPDFELQAEMQNPAFVALLKNGFPMKNAYESANVVKLVENARKTAQTDTEKRITDSIRAKGARPPENGSSQSASFIVKDDPSKLTKEDRKEIAKRVAAGERITF